VRKRLNLNLLAKNVAVVAIGHKITGMISATRIGALTTTENAKTIDRTIVVLKKRVSRVKTTKMRASDLLGTKQAIARMIRKENVRTTVGMNARIKMSRLQMAKGATREIAETGNDLTAANEFARKKSPLQQYR
jgi:hypothetical protein